MIVILVIVVGILMIGTQWYFCKIAPKPFDNKEIKNMKNTIEKYELTDEQIAVCKEIEKVFKKAQKLGLSFLAKQSEICAYRSESLKYAVPLHSLYYGEDIPCYILYRCILDSGADDTEHFPIGFIQSEDENEIKM